MRRIPLTLRALVLVPLLAAGLDQVRVAAFCPGGTESCLQAAGGGSLGALGAVVLVLYAAAVALSVRWLGGDTARRRWAAASGGLLAVCGGHAALAGLIGQGATTGGGWLHVLPLILVAGALLALVLRAAPAALRLLRRLRPRAPRPRVTVSPVRRARPFAAAAFSRVAALTAAGRAPPRALA